MKIELKKISINERLSEETTCFTADIYIDNVKCGHASNRGHGGNTDYYPLDNAIAQGLIKDAEKFCKALPPIDSDNFVLDMDLEFYIDQLVDAEHNKKSIRQFESKVAKECLKSICYGIAGREYRFRGWKGRTIAEVMALPQGRAAISKLITEIQSTLKPNEKILNTNLGDLLK